MLFTWDETKRYLNLKKHGLDFADAEQIFNGPIMLYEDNKYDYEEQRMIAVGLLQNLVVLIVHVESNNEIRIISMRKANKDDAPELAQENFDTAKFKVAGRSVSKSEWQTAVKKQVQTCRVTLNIDLPILEYFQALAGETDYNSLINSVLNEYLRKNTLKHNFD